MGGVEGGEGGKEGCGDGSMDGRGKGEAERGGALEVGEEVPSRGHGLEGKTVSGGPNNSLIEKEATWRVAFRKQRFPAALRRPG